MAHSDFQCLLKQPGTHLFSVQSSAPSVIIESNYSSGGLIPWWSSSTSCCLLSQPPNTTATLHAHRFQPITEQFCSFQSSLSFCFCPQSTEDLGLSGQSEKDVPDFPAVLRQPLNQDMTTIAAVVCSYCQHGKPKKKAV